MQNPIRRSLFRWVLLVSPFMLALPASAQFAQISLPADGAVVTGMTTVRARQVNTSITPLQVAVVLFQYSTDGVTWIQIAANDSIGDGTDSHALYDWEALWDTTAIRSGGYRLRARFFLNNGLIFTTPPITVGVNAPPTALAMGTISDAGVADFNGAASSDPDDSIVAWDWDFGDGGTTSGPIPSPHSFAPGQYVVTLTVTASRGAKSTDYLQVNFFPPIAEIIRIFRCIGTNIQLRTAGTALGNDGKGAGWPAYAPVDDGKTLGPISKNPGNTSSASGFFFEVLANVDGIPALCTETQIIKATYTTGPNEFTKARCEMEPGGSYNAATMVCTYHTAWTGTTDAFTGLDLSTEAKCTAQGGKFMGGKCQKAVFPQAGAVYKPDEPEPGKVANGYRVPYTYKTHPPRQIIWSDTPYHTTLKVGANLDFVGIVKGTDNKYCYTAFNVKYVVGQANSEVATLTAAACNVNRNQVPGLQ